MRSDDATWAHLLVLIEENDGSYVVYVYRLDQRGQMIKPAYKTLAHSGLIEEIQRNLGPGDYKLLIRKGRIMAFSGTISLGPAPGDSWERYFGSGF